MDTVFGQASKRVEELAVERVASLISGLLKLSGQSAWIDVFGAGKLLLVSIERVIARALRLSAIGGCDSRLPHPPRPPAPRYRACRSAGPRLCLAGPHLAANIIPYFMRCGIT